MPITFEPANVVRDRAVLTLLNVGYVEWLEQNIRRDFDVEMTA